MSRPLKNVDAPFSPGRPNSGGTQLKFKFVGSASFIVTARNAKRSVTLGLFDGSEMVGAGNVTIPPNHALPAVGEVVEVRHRMLGIEGHLAANPQRRVLHARGWRHARCHRRPAPRLLSH